MTAAETPKPTCLHCGKPLQAFNWRLVTDPGQKWGRNGDNTFCGVRCGYSYAVDMQKGVTTT